MFNIGYTYWPNLAVLETAFLIGTRNSLEVNSTSLVLESLVLKAKIWYNVGMTVEERKIAVDQAIANQRLEGGEVSAETRKVMDDYVAGKMSAKEAAEQVYARYGI